ncbi:MAG TPA: ABC transporter substrate-binding protein [Anaerolineae bacterium]|nr:ABC transporter substrate-binding protein [Anaerolineae bacterium]HQH40004.1 ABC transporter substrate-binding protein [Anaerolineae bacterium]
MFRRIGWQMLLVGMGFLIAAAVLTYLATTYTTEFRPANGGTYVESVGGYPQSLNPLLSLYNDADSDVVSLVFSGMTRMGMSGAVEPDLAKSWEIDPSGITYTFQLNPNVLWHDGYYFTADDVLFTIGLLQDPDYPGPADIGALWRSVKATKKDDYTVQIALEEPYAPFLDYTTVGLLPAHKLSGIRAADLPALEFNRQAIGTGPFRMTEVETEAGQITSITFKRFPRYYGTAPYLENIVLRFYPTPRAAFEAYQDGIVEGVARITLDILPQAFTNENLKLHSAETAEMVMLYFNESVTDTLPFNTTQVRQALFYALDRQAIVDNVLMGQAIIPQTPLLPGTWAYNTEGVPLYTYNPQQALDLLAEAGWRRDPTTGILRHTAGVPLTFSLMVANEDQDLAVAQEIVAQWARIGVSATVQGVPPLAFSGVLESRSYEAALVHLVLPGDPDPYPFWHETQALVGQGQNYAGFQHRRISEVIEQARVTINPQQRLTLYHEFQQLFMGEVPAIPLYVPVYTYAIDMRVNGDQIGPLMHSGDRFRTVADWYVLQRRVVASRQQP